MAIFFFIADKSLTLTQHVNADNGPPLIYIYMIIMIIDRNQVQSHYVDEWNCIRDHKDASKNELLYMF